jgi:hypothetical protein
MSQADAGWPAGLRHAHGCSGHARARVPARAVLGLGLVQLSDVIPGLLAP